MSGVRLVVVGCPRSGTGYMAALLNAAGVRCGHESVYAMEGSPRSDRGYMAALFASHGLAFAPGDGWEADSSWRAVERLPLGCPTVHVVRNPLAVARSLVRFGVLDVLGATDPFAVWLDFVRRCEEHADETVMLERLDAADLERVLRAGGFPTGRAEQAVASTPRNINATGHSHERAVKVATNPRRRRI